MAMLVVVIALMCSMALMVGLLGALFGELAPTSYERKSERLIAASQSGLQAGLAAVRQAYTMGSDGAKNGDRTKLPCYTEAAPLKGQVGGLDASQYAPGYWVRVDYYAVNPAGQSADWRSSKSIMCNPGAGPSTTPVYALVTAIGCVNAAVACSGWTDGRTSEAVYLLNRTDQATLGGPIHSDLVSSSTKNLCWEAATYPATSGTKVTLATCVLGKPAQTWSYRGDYSIALAPTQSTTTPPTGGLCVNVDTGPATTTTTTVTSTPSPTTTTGTTTSATTYYNNGGQPKSSTTNTYTTTGVTTPPPTTSLATSTTPGSITGASLQPCQSGATPQLWAYNDNGEFQGVDQTKTLTNVCLTTNGSYAVAAQLTAAACDVSKDNWTPDAAAGAGNAGTATGQLVNYGEYGRCLDVSNQDVNFPWLIDYPCKQDPNPAHQVTWNQRWSSGTSATTQLLTNTPSGQYCLTTPTSAGGYVLVKPCDANRQDQQWTMLGNTSNRSTAYTIVDSSGRCLSLGAPGPGRADLSSWSSITADACDGTFKQKWNSPPLPIGGTLASEREITGGR